ncbi:MAG: hypothetical protein KIT11_11075 [Fimbriimonadaceae bacterium]|nr:hypothetical protein [Fimbriimonadaceae bacterium]QYK55863.1 MAG: hypothetical protein KF733_12745 [Fimbriimonadaceae bacterium]
MGQIRTIRNGSRERRGQTLVIAIILLGVLVTLGFAFASILSTNISNAARGQERNVATDLARAGIDLAHYQLRYSALGADWRPAPTPPSADAQGFSKDPDALYLRPASPFGVPSDTGVPLLSNDLGGPDGLGAYSRVFFERGRALVRVRYSPADYDAFANPTGQLRQPGKARGNIVIEVIGRPGGLLTGGRVDPSLLLAERVKVQGFADYAEKQAELGPRLGRLRHLDSIIIGSRRMIAFASIGIVETARYITNKYKVSRPAEIGFPTSEFNPNARDPFDEAGIGAVYGDGQAPYQPGEVLPVVGTLAWGRAVPDGTPGQGNNWGSVPGGGSLHSNADLVVFGRNDIVLNSFLNEEWSVAGEIRPAGAASMLRIARQVYTGGVWQSGWQDNLQTVPSTVNTPLVVTARPGNNQYPLESVDEIFSTLGSVLRDGTAKQDRDGYVRGAARKDPPSMMDQDPQSGNDRYLSLTRDSGALVNGRNVGRFGLGRGVYVDSSERGNTSNQDERQVAGAVKSLANDWLTPNNPNSQGWRGPFYIPLAASLRLLPDGFEIVRDSRSSQGSWRDLNGQNTNQSRARFRLRTVEYPAGSGDFQTMVLDSVTQPALVGRPGGSLSDDDFRQSGRLFNGVLYFVGDVRVRGVIPTDQQLTVVSGGTVYVDGSITKGTIDELGRVLTRPSRSAAMLMARDYVCLNTTLFFGPAPGETVEEKDENRSTDAPNPFELRIDKPEILLETAFLLDPQTQGGNPANPSTWRPYANSYREWSSNSALTAHLVTASAADDNGPSFVSMDVYPGTYLSGGSWGSFLYPRLIDFGGSTVRFNAADRFFTGGQPNIPVYGLGDPSRNGYPRFESVAMPLVGSAFTYSGRQLSDAGGTTGVYALAVQDPTYFRVRLNGVGNLPNKNYLAARTAIAPHDVRIEAAMYAEEGSFFVIPGNWFNLNSQDTRLAWLDRSASGLYPGMNDAEANLRRFQLFGHSPEVPFYAEPLDVKVTIVGAVSENMPAPISAQAEWLRKWGWIPRAIGATGRRIPVSHTDGRDLAAEPTVPNLTIVYDPAIGTATSDGRTPLRADSLGRVLPPMPRLPVSPTLDYFGEVNP